ncbi:hypothetical protein OHC33_001219 [Knufia fluminis]|uniref:Kelch repeat-containing protein n=1 Tax=Knufia fluminis TaxID=191047 RepID=A0AAN8EKW8_9EURO|nr:hypothetical protein OHC33_001219 [Knufia fluminis]
MDFETGIPAARRRSSAFTEIGLEGHDPILDEKIKVDRPRLAVRFRSNVSVVEPNAIESNPPTPVPTSPIVSQKSFLSRVPFAQLALLISLIGLAFPVFHGGSSQSRLMSPLAQAVPVTPRVQTPETLPAKRQTATTDVCKRWSGQSAVVNGTVYYYGGRATTSPDQTTDQWNNDFLSLDLTKSWQIGSPSLTGLPTPSGPPAVSLGQLWSSTDDLYLYGGQFSDAPATSPVPFSLWSYDIAGSKWNEHQNPTFEDGTPVQRASEGAGISVPSLGRGFYFGGHLDGYTTVGWSQSIERVYLPSMLEFTMPGFTNSEIQSASPAGADGAYRNITVGSSGFPERADGVLVYIPGYSENGIIVDLAGGTDQTFTQLNVIDVFDIASSTWYKQATEGAYPDVRVNPCAVAASSADGTSTQIHFYGGQNLIPAGSQTQYDDMWILTVPSFTWIKVDTEGQSSPPARAGHTCHIWNGQMVVIGGYVGQELSCDSPGIYVFNTSSLEWQSEYTALDAGDDALNRQKAQNDDPNALQGSFGYQVPPAVQSVVGGDAVGGATVTAPAQTPTGGPLATGAPATYTVTGSDGSVVTETATPGNGDSSGGSGGNSGPNIGAIVAGVVAGILFLVVLYLAFCAYIYRKQLKLYKNHAAMLQHDALNNDTNTFTPGFVVSRPGNPNSNSNEKSGSSHGTAGRTSTSDNRSQRSGFAGSSAANSSNQTGIMQHYPYDSVMALKQAAGRTNSNGSTEDLLKGQEPSFIGVLLSPRKSLRVVNN